jgi:hypothetical protein
VRKLQRPRNEPSSRINKVKKTGNVAQVVELLSSNPRPTKKRKEPSNRVRGTLLGNNTGLGTGPLPINQPGKTQHSQGVGRRAQKGLASGVGKN